MSVPLVLNVMDSASPAVSAMDEHTEHCNALPYTFQRNEDLVLTARPTPIHFPAPRTFTVELDEQLGPNEHVGLTGDSSELGAWDPSRSVQLTRKSNTVWSTVVSITSPTKLSYRYFIYSLDSLGRMQIKRWESYVEPRLMRTCNLGCSRTDSFGWIDDREYAARGWLINEAVIQLKLFNNAFSFNHTTPKKMLVKLAPLANNTEVPNYNESLSNAEVVNMKYGKSILKRQSDYGVLYSKGDVVMFHIAVPLGLESGSFALVIHYEDYMPLGHAVIVPSLLSENEGRLELNIVGSDSDKGIGKTNISYVVVKPFSGVRLNFRTSYAYTWQQDWNKLLVGHRGDGVSFRPNGSPIIENTIASYLKAYESKADMIELDVHLTKDLIPVIYHDYKIFTCISRVEPITQNDLVPVYLKDVLYSELVEITTYRVINDEIVKFAASKDEEVPEKRLFPTLEQVFKDLPIGLGINIEIKWPQALIDGTLEAVQMDDKNLFVDTILTTTLRHGCGRMLIFSSFDADICTMVRLKQNILPVMFLTQGANHKWTAYEDPRCISIEAAVNNAQAFELNGIAPHAKDVLNDPQLPRLATDLNQKVFLWGDDINSLERVRFFEEAGVTANIFDRVDLIIPVDKPAGIYDNNKTIEYFKGQCPR